MRPSCTVPCFAEAKSLPLPQVIERHLVLMRLTQDDMVNSIIRDQEKLAAEHKLAKEALQENRAQRLASLKANATKRAAERAETKENDVSALLASNKLDSKRANLTLNRSRNQNAQATSAKLRNRLAQKLKAGEAGSEVAEDDDFDSNQGTSLADEGGNSEPPKTMEELEAEMAERFEAEERVLLQTLKEEAAAKEAAINAEIAKKKAELEKQKKTKIDQAMAKQKVALSEADAAKLVKKFDSEFKTAEKRLDSQRTMHTSSLKDKLKKRKAAKQKRLKKAQANEKLHAEMEHKKQETEAEFKKIKENETETLEAKVQESTEANAKEGTGAKKGVEVAIASVLEERHNKEVQELEGRKQDLRKIAISQAEMRVDDECDEEVTIAQARQEEEMTALLSKSAGMEEAAMNKERKALARKHVRELDTIRKNFKPAKEEAVALAKSEADGNYAQAMIELRDRQYDEVAATLEAFAPEGEASTGALKGTASQMEDLSKQLEEESQNRARELEAERAAFEQEHKQQMEAELQQLENDAEAERAREQELAQQKLDVLKKTENAGRSAEENSPGCGAIGHGNVGHERAEAND